MTIAKAIKVAAHATGKAGLGVASEQRTQAPDEARINAAIGGITFTRAACLFEKYTFAAAGCSPSWPPEFR